MTGKRGCSGHKGGWLQGLGLCLNELTLGPAVGLTSMLWSHRVLLLLLAFPRAFQDQRPRQTSKENGAWDILKCPEPHLELTT